MEIYVDGASRGNPGAAAIGIVIIDGDGKTLLEKGEFIGTQTNNVAEYRALITALEEARAFQPRHLNIKSDSQLIVRQVTGEYKIKQEHLLALHARVLDLMNEFESVHLEHISREENTRADRLANMALNTRRTHE